nr:hypothetical protein [Nakamurella aerolata]
MGTSPAAVAGTRLEHDLGHRPGKNPVTSYPQHSVQTGGTDAGQALTAEFGDPAYARVDAPATKEQKAKLAKLSPEDVTADTLAGEKIIDRLVRAPGNDAPIGGLKVTTESSWFAARPSGTEDVYKIYAESFRGPEHLAQVQDAARQVVSAALE